MADRKYYVICDSGCKFESMTKEQIFAAIAQAVSDGAISDIDTGFITTVKTINGKPLRFFVGLQSEYEALSDAERENCFALITNDVTTQALNAAIESLNIQINEIASGLQNGDFVVEKARAAVTTDITNAGFQTATEETEFEDGCYLFMMEDVINKMYYDFGVVNVTSKGVQSCLTMNQIIKNQCYFITIHPVLSDLPRRIKIYAYSMADYDTTDVTAENIAGIRYKRIR